MVLPAGPVFRLRHLQNPEEFREAEEVQVAAWGMVEEHPIPSPLQRAIEDNGGLVLGAFTEDRLAGLSLGFLGREGGTEFHYSHMTAVRPEFQNHRLGFRLKCYQREEARKQGLGEIRWTYDPLQSKNAFLNVRLLGARPRVYHVHYYGPMGSAVNRGLASDRFRVSWELESPRVAARIGGRYPTPDEDLSTWKAGQSLVDTEVDRAGVRIPMSVSSPSGPTASVEIPFDLASVRSREPAALHSWREATRTALREALTVGYQVDDFAVLSLRQERRSFYFLSEKEKDDPSSPRPIG